MVACDSEIILNWRKTCEDPDSTEKDHSSGTNTTGRT